VLNEHGKKTITSAKKVLMMKSPIKICETCEGEGRIEYDAPTPHNFGRDIGYIDSVWDDCYECDGFGAMPIDEYDDFSA